MVYFSYEKGCWICPSCPVARQTSLTNNTTGNIFPFAPDTSLALTVPYETLGNPDFDPGKMLISSIVLI